MRFHIGFSKRISIKKLIEIIGFLFVAFLTFFGIYDITHAEEVYSSFNTNSSFINYIKGENLTGSSNFTNYYNFQYNNSQIQKNNTNGYGYRFYLNNNDRYFVNATSPNATSGGGSPISLDYVSQYLDFNFTNNDYCINPTSDLKSMNIRFPLEMSTYFSDYSTFNQTSQIDTFQVRIKANDEGNDVPYITTCTKELLSDFSSDYYMITCNNVFQGNSKITIESFDIEILNYVPFNDIYNHDVSNKKIVSIPILGVSSSHRLAGFNKSFYYSCSDDEPNVSGGFPDNTDPAGLNDIYDVIKGNYDSNLPGITMNNFIDIPSNFSDLLLLPLDVISAIINNSTGTCETYSIDMSSIVSKWGSPNSHYYLQLPCMRTVLSNKLGSLYTLCDLLFCFILFYNIAMHIVRLINAITYGEDLFSIFYVPTERSEMLVGTSDGSYTRSRGWFE